MTLIRVRDLFFSYRKGLEKVSVLNGLSLDIEKGEFLAIQGRSGSGKSTLFHVLGCLLRPDAGSVVFEGRELTRLTEDERAFVRNGRVGFVFQQFHLLPRATVLENILLSTVYPAEVSRRNASVREKATRLAERVGLGDKLQRYPNELSGGEQQRVAIARALMTDAPLILADEPTGNLDSRTAEGILELLRELHREGRTIVIITHDDALASKCDRVLRMKDGRFEESSQLAGAEVASSTMEALPSARSYRLWRAMLPLAMKNIALNKRRAALTMLGIVVGIASVFAMVTFAQFAKRKILEGYQDLGVNSVVIRGHENWMRQATQKVDVLFQSFDLEKDIAPLRRVFPEIERLSPVMDSWGNSVHYGGQQIAGEVVVMGVNASYLGVVGRELRSGKNFTPHHVEGRSAVCLIGAEVAERLFRNVTPLGKILFLTTHSSRSFPCEVVGTLASITSNKEWNKPNLNVIVPFTYFQSVNERWDSELDKFVAQLFAGEDVERVSSAIKVYFQRKYGSSGRFFVDTDALLLAQMKKFLALFSILLTAIALVTLAVGGIGITNMMLVSVAERLKEIGLRKALGATSRSVRVQFLLEAMLICGVAGAFGVILGFSAYETIIYLASRVISKITFEWVFEPIALVIAFVATIAVGITSGIVPALKAEKLEVIEALRSE